MSSKVERTTPMISKLSPWWGEEEEFNFFIYGISVGDEGAEERVGGVVEWNKKVVTLLV